MKTTTIKKTIGLIKEYQNKNYFYDEEVIKNKIEERNHYIKQGQKDLLNLYPDEVIIKTIKKETLKRAFYNTALNLHKAIKENNKEYLLNHIRYDQKLTIKLYQLFTGQKLPKTNKQIKLIINN